LKNHVLLAAAAVALVGALAAATTTASATPTKTSRCSGCHSGVNVPVTATLATTSATAATYDLSAPTATAIGVFDGTTKVTYFVATTGRISVPFGKTYTIYAVKGPTTSDGIGTTSATAVAPAPADTTAPVTTSDAVASYVGSAAIHLTATDNVGVTATYYILDGGTQTAGTTVSISTVGSHTLEFWSVDGANNVETHHTVSFAVTAPAPAPDTIAPVTTSDALANYGGSATIKLTATDNVGVTATYYILDGGTQTAGTTVNISTVGSHTLEFWSVDAAGNVEAHTTVGFTLTTPVPAPDATAPVTTSNAKASYVGTAAILLTAVDEAGGSGVAHTYYILDGGTQVEGTSVTTSVLGGHTLSFWSVDGSGNVEAASTASFEVLATPVAVNRCSLRVSDSTIARYHRAKLHGTISPALVGDHASLYVKKPGSTRWVKIASPVTTAANTTGGATWSYSYLCKYHGTYRFQVRFNGMTSSTVKVYVR